MTSHLMILCLTNMIKRQVEWASRVQDILSFFSELHSADAVYHICCTRYGRTSE